MLGQPRDADLHMILPELSGTMKVIRQKPLGGTDQHKTGVRHDDHAELQILGIDRLTLREQVHGVTTLRSDGERGDDSGLAPLQVIVIDQRGALPQCRVVRRYSIPDLDAERTDVNVGHVAMPTVSLASGIEMGSRVDLIRCRESAGFRAAC